MRAIFVIQPSYYRLVYQCEGVKYSHAPLIFDPTLFLLSLPLEEVLGVRSISCHDIEFNASSA